VESPRGDHRKGLPEPGETTKRQNKKRNKEQNWNPTVGPVKTPQPKPPLVPQSQGHRLSKVRRGCNGWSHRLETKFGGVLELKKWRDAPGPTTFSCDCPRGGNGAKGVTGQ